MKNPAGRRAPGRAAAPDTGFRQPTPLVIGALS